MAYSIITQKNTVLILKNAIFWVVTPRGSCKNRHFGGMYAFMIRVTRTGEQGTTLAVTSNGSTLQEPHGITPQKMTFFIVTAV
jgi:hypothetical protein